MTGSDRERDVAALRALLVALRYGSHTFTTHELAERILASDWLAEHDKAVAAKTLQDAADDLGPLVDAQHPDALNPDQWLRDRADRIGADDA